MAGSQIPNIAYWVCPNCVQYIASGTDHGPDTVNLDVHCPVCAGCRCHSSEMKEPRADEWHLTSDDRAVRDGYLEMRSVSRVVDRFLKMPQISL